MFEARGGGKWKVCRPARFCSPMLWSRGPRGGCLPDKAEAREPAMEAGGVASRHPRYPRRHAMSCVAECALRASR